MAVMYGPVLRKLRESKGRNQADVARSVAISPAQLARLETNQRGLYVEDFVRIAEALGEKAGNLLPNDVGDFGHLKPLIDRLAPLSAEQLKLVTTIIDNVVRLAAISSENEAPTSKKRGKTKPMPARKSRR